MKVSARHSDIATGNYPVIAYQLHGNCYLNVTNRCNLRCRFCPKFNSTWDVQQYDLRLRQEPSVASMLIAVGDPSNYKEIVFCGLGEPTLRLYQILTVAHKLRQRGAKRIRINTDGLANLAHGQDITPDLEGYIDALSISLNAQDERIYQQHCRPSQSGSYQAVLEFAGKAKTFVPDVTLTAISGLPGVEISSCQKIAEDIGVKFRERVLDQVG